MSYTRKYMIVCDQCDDGFAGPNGGDYEPDNFARGDLGVFAYLADEAVGMGFLRLFHAQGEAWFCGPKCLVKWAKAEQ